MLPLLLFLGILVRVSQAYTVTGFLPIFQDDNIFSSIRGFSSGGGVKYRYELVHASHQRYGEFSSSNEAFLRFVGSTTWVNPSGSFGFYLHMYELTNGKYRLTSVSDVSGPLYGYKGIIPGSDKLQPDVVLLENDGGGVNIIKRNSQGNYVVDGTLDPAAAPIFSVSDDTTWRLTTSGEDITYLYVEAGLEYELKKEAGVWSWGFSSRPNPPLTNPRSFLLNENELIYVSQYHTPLVIKIFNFNGTGWDTVLDYEEYVYSPPPTEFQIETCTLVEIQEGEVLMTSSLVQWGNASGSFNTDTYDYTIEKTNETWSVTKEVTFDRFDNYTSPSSGGFSACSQTYSYILSDQSRIFYKIPADRLFMGLDVSAQLYRRFPNGTKDVLFETPINPLNAGRDITVMENLDKFVIFIWGRSAVDVYDISNGGFALEDTLNLPISPSSNTLFLSLSSIENTLIMSFDSQRFVIGGFNY